MSLLQDAESIRCIGQAADERCVIIAKWRHGDDVLHLEFRDRALTFAVEQRRSRDRAGRAFRSDAESICPQTPVVGQAEEASVEADDA